MVHCASLASAILLQIVPSLPQSESLKIVLCRAALGNGGIYNEGLIFSRSHGFKPT